MIDEPPVKVDLPDNSPQNEPAEYPRRVLVLDDNESNRMLLKFALQMGMFEQTEVGSGEAALEVWKEKGFAFAFLDIVLPGISGLEVCRRLRAADPGIGLVMCSTNDEPEIVAEAIAAGCDMFLVKPLQLDVLLNIVRAMDRAALRSSSNVLVVGNTAKPHLVSRQPQESKDAPKISTSEWAQVIRKTSTGELRG
jgi:CheY-like chemotaxis protein